MSNATSDIVFGDDNSRATPKLSPSKRPPEIQRESFDMSPHPSAIMLGATTTLLLTATLRTLWLLFFG